MMRRLTLGVRHSPIYNIIPARIAPRARGHGTAAPPLAGGPGRFPLRNADPGRPASHSAQRIVVDPRGSGLLFFML